MCWRFVYFCPHSDEFISETSQISAKILFYDTASFRTKPLLEMHLSDVTFRYLENGVKYTKHLPYIGDSVLNSVEWLFQKKIKCALPFMFLVLNKLHKLIFF